MANISVTNFDEVKKHLRDELKILSDRLDKSVKSINGSDDPTRLNSIRDLLGLVKLVSDVMEKISFSPNINVNVPDVIVPEIRVPDINIPEIKVPNINYPNIPAPIVNVSPSEVNIDLSSVIDALGPLQLISDDASKPIAVRLSDGKKFLQALKTIGDQQRGVIQAFSNSNGLDQSEFRTTVRDVDDILAPYKITDKDDDASPNYYGFTKADGSWYIMKETVSAGADTYRYIYGGSGYTTNWTNRAALSYDYFYTAF